MTARARAKGQALARGRAVYLRTPTPADAAEVTKLYRASRTLHGRWVQAPDTLRRFRDFLERCSENSVVGTLVCRSEDRAVVGTVVLSQIFLGNFKSAYTGYYAGAAHAGRGYMTEGLELACRLAFSKLGLHRLEANIQPENTASIALNSARSIS